MRILDYIASGGLFVNVAGFPFFCYWNHEEGRSNTVIKPTYVLDRATHAIIGFNNFNDTLLYRDFRISLDARSPTEVAIFQNAEDRRYAGDSLSLNIERVTQFRAVVPGNPNIVPIVRAEEGRIYPIAAIKRGSGYLMISGLELRSEEAPIVSNAIRNWLLTSGENFGWHIAHKMTMLSALMGFIEYNRCNLSS